MAKNKIWSKLIGSRPINKQANIVTPYKYKASFFYYKFNQFENQKIRITLNSSDNRLLDRYVREIIEKARKSGALIGSGSYEPKTSYASKTNKLLKTSVHKRLIEIIKPTQKTLNVLMGLHLPTKVDVKIGSMPIKQAKFTKRCMGYKKEY